MQLTIHADGGSRGNPGIAGGGIVVYSDEQEIYATGISFGTKTNNEAEYLAVLNALKWLTEFSKQQTISNVQFFLDSKLVVEQLNKTWKVKEPRLKPLATQCWQILESLPYQIKFSHVRRAYNEQADLLANQAMDAATLI
jgi:ribonuclease HI